MHLNIYNLYCSTLLLSGQAETKNRLDNIGGQRKLIIYLRKTLTQIYIFFSTIKHRIY